MKKFNDEGVYAKKKIIKQANEELKQVVEPKEVPKQITDKEGLDGACDAAHDISIIDNNLFIAGTKLGRASGC